MELNVNEWKEFNITKLFDIGAGNYYYSDDYDEGKTPYISASATNNGVGQMINLPPDFSGNKIVTGKVECKAFYQGDPFCATSDANVFSPKFTMSKYVGLFLTSIISFNENGKWSYGRQCRVGDSKGIKIKLPIKKREDETPVYDEKKTFSDDGYIPDWEFMENYIKSLNCEPPKTKIDGKGILDLNIEEWKEFCLGDIFDIKKGKRLTSEDQTKGDTPYIGAIDSNNGVANYIGQKAIHDGNTISLSYNGSVGETFYQPTPFWATDDVNVLYFRPQNNIIFNKYIALFFCAVLRQEKYRYSYGRKWVLESMRTTTIKLPSNAGKPDYAFMERYMKALPYGDRI